jgi:hypothetical protein
MIRRFMVESSLKPGQLSKQNSPARKSTYLETVHNNLLVPGLGRDLAQVYFECSGSNLHFGTLLDSVLRGQ